MTTANRSTWTCRLVGMAVIIGGMAYSSVVAADGLGEQATNPVANLVSFRMQYQNSPSMNNADGSSQAGIIQVVAPFTTSSEAIPLWVTRWTTPWVKTPDIPGVGSKKGLSDTSGLIFAVPDFGLQGHTIGLGTSVSIPTGGDNEFTGSGQWTLGPAAVYLNTQTKGLQWGLLAFQNWDIASARKDAADVSNLNLQPILTKHFEGGWYVGAPDLPQTYNFETNHWTTNIGAQVGRIFPWGKQPVQVFGGLYYNATSDNDVIDAEWTFKLNLSLLLPKG